MKVNAVILEDIDDDGHLCEIILAEDRHFYRIKKKADCTSRVYGEEIGEEVA